MTQDNPSIEKTDVLVVGGGPVGCLVSLQLNRFKCSTVTVEKEDKPSIPIYGRCDASSARHSSSWSVLG